MIRKLLHRYLPEQFHDPFGLFVRLIRSKEPAARFAMGASLMGLLLSPLDLLLSIAERRRYSRARHPELPLIFVCGPPRSGTTLVAQTLINHLPVAYLNNLTSLFPRSPITANRLFGRLLGRPDPSYRNFYGRTAGFSGPNDALYLWDRWLGKDRTRIVTALDEVQKNDMRRFFGALEAFSCRPLLAKNNNLNTCAALIAEALPTSYFLCLERDPVFLAQSLLNARTVIHGDAGVPYGMTDPGSSVRRASGIVDDVCDQVEFHRRLGREQQARVGHDRFWIVSYEAFCRDPAAVVRRAAERILGRPLDGGALDHLRPFEASRRARIDPETFEKIEARLRGQGCGSS